MTAARSDTDDQESSQPPRRRDEEAARRRRSAAAAAVTRRQAITAPACVGADTRAVIRRLKPGDVAVINEPNLDRRLARDILATGCAAVINGSDRARSRDIGSALLTDAGVIVIDGLGRTILERVEDGVDVAIVDRFVLVDDTVIGTGARLVATEIQRRRSMVRDIEAEELEAFAAEAVGYLSEHLSLVTHGVGVAGLDSIVRDRHVLLVTSGVDAEHELELLINGGYLNELNPVLVGVESGADILLQANRTPDVIVGNFGKITDRALTSGARLLFHRRNAIDDPGRDRVQELDLEFTEVNVDATAEDIAMLALHEAGAELIIEVGTETAVVDPPSGNRIPPSSFVTRMRVGPILVDATGVSRLYRRTVRSRDLVMLFVAAAVTIAIIAWTSEPIRVLVRGYWATLAMVGVLQ